MKKTTIIATGSILGAISVASVSAFAIYYNKYNNLDKSLEGINDKNPLKFVSIKMHASETAAPVERIYKIQDNEKTLEDLMLHHSADFSLSAPGQFGRMLLGVYGTQVSYASDHSWWQIRSKSYLEHHPASGDSSAKQAFALGIGANAIELTFSEEIDIYKVS